MNLLKTAVVAVAVVGFAVAGCSKVKNSPTATASTTATASNTELPNTELERAIEEAEGGNTIAQFNLGVMYMNGAGVAQDDAKALNWYHLAAEQGHVHAASNLGWMYDGHGGSTPRDVAESLKWYRKAAEQGFAEAQYNLGASYYHGDGVPKDDVEAYAWLSVAAAGGDLDAAKAIDQMSKLLTSRQLADCQKRAAEYTEKYSGGK